METQQFYEKVLGEHVQIHRSFDIFIKHIKLPDEQWLDTTDVCQRLRISKRSLAYLRKSKQLAYKTKGSKIYYHVKDVDAYPASGGRTKKDKP